MTRDPSEDNTADQKSPQGLEAEETAYSPSPDHLSPSEAPTLSGFYSTDTESLQLRPGQTLGRRYRIRNLLGQGGMGEVWHAIDMKLRVDVALKSVLKGRAHDAGYLERLRQEVRLAREVISPNVCRIFDLIEQDDLELLSMEYIDGQTLLEVLYERGPLELGEARDLALQFLAGLDAIHQAGLVHRDLKPENIMITRAGRVVVMDFGLAKVQEENASATVVGTPAYMAPEQLRGGSIDARADVFAAGVCLAEMISEEGVKSSKSREHVWSGVRELPPRLPDSPWDPVIRQAVSQDAGDRFSSARELAHALAETTLRVAGSEDKKPYPGLAAFTKDDAEYFFGREAEVEAVWKKLRRPHLLAIIGPSGAGKSSFLRAGLMPAAPVGWSSVICKPGDDPFSSLAEELIPELSDDQEAMRSLLRFDNLDSAVEVLSRWRARHQEGLLAIDQFEELFTRNPPEVQQRFSKLLGRLVVDSDLHVLVCMRDDFLIHCHSQPDLAPLFSELTPLGPPVGAALRRALVQPALACGYRFEDEELVDEMLSQVREERGALPLLAFAASSLWEKRDRDQGLLTRTTYRDIGGVGGALAQHAEKTLERIGGDRIRMVREIFRNLVTAENTRAARHVEELLSLFEDQEAAREVLDKLIDARLLTSFDIPGSRDEKEGKAAQGVEIIHESLLRAWPRLVRWRTQDADSALLLDQLRQSARLWDTRGRPEDLLWTDTSYLEYRAWRERYKGRLPTVERAFAEAMEERAGRKRRHRRSLVAASFILLIVVLAALGMLWRRSERARGDAVAEAKRAEAAKFQALGRLEIESSPTSAVAFSLASLGHLDDPNVRRFALQALWQGPTATELGNQGYPPAGDYGHYWSLDFSPDGLWLAARDDQGALHLWAAGATEPEILGGNVRSVIFGPNSDLIVTDNADGVIEVWSVETRQVTASFDAGAASWISLAEEAEQLYVFTAETNGSILVRRLTLGKTLGSEAERVGSWPMQAAVVDPSGENVFYADGDSLLRRSTDEAVGEPVSIGRHEERIEHITTHMGRTLASANEQGEVRLWSAVANAPQEPRVLAGNQAIVGMDFDHTGTMLVVARAGNRSDLFRLDGPPSAAPIALKRGEIVQATDVTFHPSGRAFAMGAWNSSSLWRITRGYPYIFRSHTARASGLVFDPEGRWLASSSADGTLRLWALEPDGKDRVLFQDESEELLVLDTDARGLRIVAGSGTGNVRVLPVDGSPPALLGGFASQVLSVAITSDGRYAAGAGGQFDAAEAVIRIWDLSGEEPTQVLDAGDGLFIRDIAFMPDGNLVSGGVGGVRHWDRQTGSSRLLREGIVWGLAVSPDGRLVLSSAGMAPSEVQLFDLETGTATPLRVHGGQVYTVTFDPAGESTISVDFSGVVRVAPIGGDAAHHLVGPPLALWEVAADPKGRWIAASGASGEVRVWPFPTAGTPAMSLTEEEFRAMLESETNLRVGPDPSTPTGYRLNVAPTARWSVSSTE